MTPPPELDEVEQMIAQFKVQREKWHGNAGYARKLDIEIYALGLLAGRLHWAEPNEQKD